MWDEITYPFPNFNGASTVGMDKEFHPTYYNGCTYLFMLKLKLIHVSITHYMPHCVTLDRVAKSFEYTWLSLTLIITTITTTTVTIIITSANPHPLNLCLHYRLFRRRSKKTSKLRVTGLWVGNSPGTGEFPAQMTSNAENVSIWWRHHDMLCLWLSSYYSICWMT